MSGEVAEVEEEVESSPQAAAHLRIKRANSRTELAEAKQIGQMDGLPIEADLGALEAEGAQAQEDEASSPQASKLLAARRRHAASKANPLQVVQPLPQDFQSDSADLQQDLAEPNSPQGSCLLRQKRLSNSSRGTSPQERLSPEPLQLLLAGTGGADAFVYEEEEIAEPGSPQAPGRRFRIHNKSKVAITEATTPQLNTKPWVDDAPSSPQASRMLQQKRRSGSSKSSSPEALRPVIPDGTTSPDAPNQESAPHGMDSGSSPEELQGSAFDWATACKAMPVGEAAEPESEQEEEDACSPQARQMLRSKVKRHHGQRNLQQETPTSKHMPEGGIEQSELDKLSTSAPIRREASLKGGLGQRELDAMSSHAPGDKDRGLGQHELDALSTVAPDDRESSHQRTQSPSSSSSSGCRQSAIKPGDQRGLSQEELDALMLPAGQEEPDWGTCAPSSPVRSKLRQKPGDEGLGSAVSSRNQGKPADDMNCELLRLEETPCDDAESSPCARQMLQAKRAHAAGTKAADAEEHEEVSESSPCARQMLQAKRANYAFAQASGTGPFDQEPADRGTSAIAAAAAHCGGLSQEELDALAEA